MRSFNELFSALLAGDEDLQIEAKRATDVGKALLFTVTSFSNEPGMGGGYLLLGIARPAAGQPYQIVGVPDPDKLQCDLAAQCSTEFNHTIRPEISREIVDGKAVLVVRIPEVSPAEKPIYVKKYNLPQGACRRIGSTDQHCTEDDLALFYSLRDEQSYDAAPASGATLEDIDPAAITEYRRTRKELNPTAEELKLKNRELLIALGAAKVKGDEVQVTRAGLLLFGKATALRRLTPSARIDYILVSGQIWVPDADQPLRSTEIRQPLLLAIPRIVSLILQDLPRSFQLKGKALRRKEIPAIPSRVIREAVVNAVMHRTYREHKPIQIIRFSNRLELRNPGHSLVADDQLGQPGSRTRNETIAAVLHDVGLAETKGTGIQVMRDQMNAVNMTQPIFKSSRQADSFEVQLLTHHLFDDATVQWLAKFTHLGVTDHDAKALVLARELGFVDNATYRNVNNVDVLAASNALRRLRDVGLLEQVGKSTATIYVPTRLLLGVDSTSSGHKAALRPELSTGLKAEPLQLSPELVGLLRRLGNRSADPDLVEVAVLRLCALRPLSLDELARYVSREPQYLRKRYVRPMVQKKALVLLHPETPEHPRQAYITAPFMGDVEIPIEKKDARRWRRKQGKLF